ncbi:Fc.00g031670.m01.CDS01 [Cosmosporella sp. VM-42]
MDVENWQASRIRNSRYRQDSAVKPWPWGMQVQVIGAQGSGRHSLLNRIYADRFGDAAPLAGDHSGCRQTRIRNLPCKLWFDVPKSLTSFGEGTHLSKQGLFAMTARGLRDCDALILVYDLTNEKSFQAICKFCRRCELEGVAVAPGKSLPCLIVGTKCDRPNQVHVEDGYKLAKKLGGQFIQVSSRTGEGFGGIVEEVVDPVLDARIKLMQESEETLGEAIRTLMARTSVRKVRIKKLAKKEMEQRRPVSRARCNGAPPRWTMRPTINSLPWQPSATSRPSDSDSSDASLLVPCPPEYLLSVDLVEPAATDWAPKFDSISTGIDDGSVPLGWI